MNRKIIGIIAFQGDVIEHVRIFQKLDCTVKLVKTVADFADCSALIIPGGESTTIGFFLEQSGLSIEIKKKADKGLPIWGTCAGAILLAKNIKANIIPPHLGLMDITVTRNAYGTQVDSFYDEIEIPKLKIDHLKAAFIRAPIIESVSKKVTVLAKHKGKIIMAQEGSLIASTFHPELREDARLHEYFLSLI